MLVGARAAGFDVVGNIEWRKYYFQKDDQGRNTFAENFPGAIFKEKVEDLTPQEIERVMNPTLALSHPECLVDRNIKVYTSKGWRPVGSIRVGDLVLTHQGRFRKVTRVFRNKSTDATISVHIQMATAITETRSLRVTGEHPLLTGEGHWVRADDLCSGDKIQILAKKCQICDGMVPIHPSFNRFHCSQGCQVRTQWVNFTDKERRNQTKKAHAVTRRRVQDGVHQFSDVSVRRKGQQIQGLRSAGESSLMDLLQARGIQFEHQLPIGKYFVDVAIPNLNIAIEVDSWWHEEVERKQKDKVKQKYLEQSGWRVLRCLPEQIKDCVEEVCRVAKNHAGQYQFASFEIRNVVKLKLGSGRYLYNLSVDEDESYVAKGFVVHNCGRYSHLDAANKKTNPDRGLDAADIPLAVDLFTKLKPRFFVMDDLPASLVAHPMQAYAEKLPEYDLFPEWVSNWGYGNIQKYRNRMFMVGSLKSEGWVFTPSEMPHSITVADILEDLGDPRRPHNIANHEPQDMAVWCSRALGLGGYKKRNTWAEVRDHFAPLRAGSTLHYVRSPNSEELALRIGFYKHHWDKYSGVLTGGNAALHGLRNEPYSIRERARIQGFPDDFIFYGTLLNEKGEWNHDDNLVMVKQTGKAMPVQFCTYVSHQIMLHCLGKQAVSTNTRVLPPNGHVDAAKKWYCSNIGYADQERACGSCWLYGQCSIRREKYGIGEVATMPTKPKPPQVPRPPRPPPEPRPPAAAKRGLQRPAPTRKIVAEEDFVFRSEG